MSSIKDVARLAGVSYTTVSHVINGTRRVSSDARVRVLQAVTECGYVPNQAARSLRGIANHVLGVLVPGVSDSFCAEVTLGVERSAARAGYSVVLVNVPPGERLRKPLESLLGRRIDGLLVVAGLFDRGEIASSLGHYLKQWVIPMVFIDHESTDFPADSLMADEEAVACTALDHLLALGHRRVACISGPSGRPVSDGRVRGWRKALQKIGVEPERDWLVIKSDFSAESGLAAAQRLLGPEGVGPSAIFVGSDLMAFGALRAAAQLGISVPAQCSIMGVDGIVMGEYVYPGLTTMGESLPALGERAAGLLIERIHTKSSAPFQRLFRQPMLIKRASTGPCPGGS